MVGLVKYGLCVAAGADEVAGSCSVVYLQITNVSQQDFGAAMMRLL